MRRKKPSGWATSTLGRNICCWACCAKRSALPRRFCRSAGLKLAQIRDELARVTQEKAPPQQRQRESSLLAEFSRDLTQAAMDGQLDPLVGRDGELERVIQILCRRTKNNPVLIGEPGVGKTAIVEGLAQRIADGEVPSFLADKRVLGARPFADRGRHQVPRPV